MLFAAAISIALFLGALLGVKSNKTRSDWVLLVWMLTNAIHIAFFYLFYTKEIYKYPDLLALHFPLPLIHGVLLYLYVASVTNSYPQKKITIWVHFLPAIGTLIYLVPFILRSPEEKILSFQSGGLEYMAFQNILLIGVFISGVVYIVWSSIILKKHRKKIQHEFSTTETIDLRWLQFLVYGMAAIWLMVVFTQDNTPIFIGVSVFVILIGFFGVQQKTIFNAGSSKNPTSADDEVKTVDFQEFTEEEEAQEKYKNSGLSPEEESVLLTRLLDYMSLKKPYKNQDLTLHQLAQGLKVIPNHLSQVINNSLNQSFYDFVNAHRVKEFEREVRLESNKNYTLLSIAMDCGFSSKSSFNRHFKKITNKTPSQYIRDIADEKSRNEPRQ